MGHERKSNHNFKDKQEQHLFKVAFAVSTLTASMINCSF
jgi:hypothetical protein